MIHSIGIDSSSFAETYPKSELSQLGRQEEISTYELR